MTERLVLLRSFDRPELTEDGRTIRGRVVPYNEVARVADSDTGPIYEELFSPGSFQRATRAARAGRVDLRYGHGDSLLDVIGPATEFEERQDGLWGTFRAMERSAPADQALAMIEAGLIGGFSVGFVPIRTLAGARGVKVRAGCHLEHVALVKEPAYTSALIESVRSAPDYQMPDELAALRPPRNEDLEARLSKLRTSD